MKAPVSSFVPDFVAVGNAAKDVVADGWRLGGTVTFAAVQAERLGLSVGVVGRTPADLGLEEALPFAAVRGAGGGDGGVVRERVRAGGADAAAAVARGADLGGGRAGGVAGGADGAAGAGVRGDRARH